MVSVDATGKAEAVYEVLRSNKSDLTEDLTIPFTITYTADPGANSTVVGAHRIVVSFAPVSADTQASAHLPIPRFIDASGAK